MEEKSIYKRHGGPLLAGPATHGMDEFRTCEVCEGTFEAFEASPGMESTMCPDCAEAYRIWHEATDWMQ